MTPKAMESLFVRWGWALGEQRPTEQDDPDYGTPTRSHPLMRAMQFPGVVEAGARAGQAMRKLTGAKAWATDPIRCKETRSYKLSTPDDLPSDILLVQKAYEALLDYNKIDALCFQARYCSRALTGKERAEKVGVPFRKYETGLHSARNCIAVTVIANLRTD